jgi:hypothetical protein
MEPVYADDHEPEIVPFIDDQVVRREALLAGKAIGPVEDTQWQVENGDILREFVDEEHARIWWSQAGGSLLCVVTTAWVALEGWAGDGRD